MTLVTLISDWQNDDFYVGSIKGLLYGKCKDINIVDITHKISTFSYIQAAFIVKNIINYYPQGTMHIIAVGGAPSQNNPPLCVKYKGQYFFGVSSNVFSLIFASEPEYAVLISENDIIKKSSFPELTILAEAVAFIINGGAIESLGQTFPNDSLCSRIMPFWDEFSIVGEVVYIDSYQNVITNITKELFLSVCKERSYSITVKSSTYNTKKISENYTDVDIISLVALFNSAGMLEFAMRDGRLAEIANIEVNTPVMVKFR